MQSILPEWLYNKITSTFLQEYLYEIRIRVGRPIIVNYKGNYQILQDRNDYGTNFICGSSDLINYILSIATKRSLYAFNNQIKNAFVTTDSGIRIGLCGTVVYNEGVIATIKDITSINIRIPHNVPNCASKILNLICCNNSVKNTLVISPPGAGKTTLLRDIVNKLSDEKRINNILVIDERCEISLGNNVTNLGMNVDVVSCSEKSFAFNECLKSMSPSVIVTDEVVKESDLISIKQAIKSGVNVVASVHAKSIDDLKQKIYFKEIIESHYFERYIVLSKRNGVGTIEAVFDENLRGIYLPFMLWKFLFVWAYYWFLVLARGDIKSIMIIVWNFYKRFYHILSSTITTYHSLKKI